MKHLLNNLSEKEKNSIREQHTDKIKIDNSKFKKLVETKSGDVKSITEQAAQPAAQPQPAQQKNYVLPAQKRADLQRQKYITYLQSVIRQLGVNDAKEYIDPVPVKTLTDLVTATNNLLSLYKQVPQK